MSLLTKSSVAIFFASILLGIAAAMLWTAQNSYLVRASSADTYGTNAGFFSTMFSIGAGAGVLSLGWILTVLGFKNGFFLFALVPLAALIPLGRMEDIRTEVRENKWQSMVSVFRSRTALRIAAIWFPFNFIQGLIIGIIPLEITKTIGVWAIGILIALFYLAPIVSAYMLGRLSDRIGRESIIPAMYLLSGAGVVGMFFGNYAALLVIAIVVLAANYGLSRTITFALVGDISTDTSVEEISALTWMVQTVALTLALFLSTILEGRAIYVVSFGAIAVSYLWFSPVRKLPLQIVRQRIAQELI